MAQRYLSLGPATDFALKVNTGMNRLGLEPGQLLEVLPQLPPGRLPIADEPFGLCR